LTKRIAIIGSGISGLVSAYLLNKQYDVHLFEANNYIGGHTHTISVHEDGHHYFVDTGFIVFNKRTYPLFCQLLEKLNVPMQPSEMSFSYRSDKKDFEYNGNNLNTLFSDRRNLISPRFYRFIKDILRFNADAKKFLRVNSKEPMSMKEFISSHSYSSLFIDSYLIPMLSAIWSKNKDDALSTSAYFILKFYLNHGLLDIFNRPQWYVLVNGSHSYIPKLTENLKDKIHLDTKIERVERKPNQVILKSSQDEYIFDMVVMANHSDEALKLIADPTKEELEILSAIPYVDNDVILHTDASIMPKSKRAWASWNYLDTGTSSATLTYYMNRLQSLQSNKDYFVSVNLTDHIREDKVIQRFKYGHPCFSQKAAAAQKKFDLINAKNNTYYAGSYWGNGFHEDGVKSAVRIAESLGVTL